MCSSVVDRAAIPHSPQRYTLATAGSPMCVAARTLAAERMPLSPIVLATYLVQAVSSAITAAVLLRFWGIYRREYLRFWGWSWAALAVYQCSAGAAFSISTVIGEPAHPLRVIASTASFAATGAHLIWLLQGALAMRRPASDLPTTTGRRGGMALGALIITTLAVLIIALTFSMELDTRRVIRACVHCIGSAVAFTIVAIVLLRRIAPNHGLGTRMLALGALAYAAAQLASLGLFVHDIKYADRLPMAEYAGLFNGLVQVVMSLGVVIWLLDDERARAAESAQALSESQSRLRRLVDDVHLIAWEFDPVSKRFAFVSPRAQDILGYSLDEWQEPGFWFAHVHPDDRDRAQKYSHEQSQRGVGHEFEYRMLHKNGEVVWFRDLTSVVKRNGEVASLHGVLIDITQHRLAEAALRASEARYRAVVEDQTELICRFLPDGVITFANEAYCRYFGLPRELLIGRTFYSRMDEESARRQREVIAALTPASPAAVSEVSSSLPDGSTRWRQWLTRAILDEQGGIREFQSVGRDVTHERLAEQALARSNDLQRLLLSELDHRVRNNLASLTALIDISSRDSRSVRDFAASIRSRVQAMSVVHAMLSREHWRSVDLRQLILTLSPGGVQAAIDMRGPDVSIVPRQATALGMVLQELLANSQKYGSLAHPNGTVEVAWELLPASANSSDRTLRLRWRERGGAPIVDAVREGVGTGLIHGLVRAELGGTARLDFQREGATHEFDFVLDDPGEAAATPAAQVEAAAAR